VLLFETAVVLLLVSLPVLVTSAADVAITGALF